MATARCAHGGADRGGARVKILLIHVHSLHNAGDNILLRVAVQQLRAHFPNATITLAMNDGASAGQNEQSRSSLGDVQIVDSFTACLKTSGADGGRWRPGAIASAPLWLAQCALTAASARWSNRALLPRDGRRRALLSAYCDADIVVSCAGNFIYSSGRIGLPLLLVLWSALFAHWLGKPLYALPQTVGPLRYAWERRLTRWALGRARLLLVRDAVSLPTLDAAGIRVATSAAALPPQAPGVDEPLPRVRLLPDLAFLFAADGDANEAPIDADGAGDARPLLGITLINWGAQSAPFTEQAAYEEAVARAVRWFVEACSGRAVIFPQVHGPTPADDDRVPARRVGARLADLGARVRVVDEAVPPDRLKAAYARCDLFIASRLHSAIFALEATVPTVAVAYQYKTHGVLATLGMDAWAIDIEAAHGAAVALLLKRAWRERVATRRHLEATLPAVRYRAALAAEWIACDVELLAARRNRR